MKLAIYYIVALVAILLQIIIFGGDFSANLVLAVIVVSTLQLRASDVAPIAIIAGLLLDINAGTFFGLNIIFLVFAAMMAKFVLHLGESATGYWNVIVTLGILEILYLFVQLVIIFSADRYTQLGAYILQSFWQLALTLAVGSLLYLASGWLESYLTSGHIKKRWLRG